MTGKEVAKFRSLFEGECRKLIFSYHTPRVKMCKEVQRCNGQNYTISVFSLSEICSENKIATTKYPCKKSTGEVTTCYR